MDEVHGSEDWRGAGSEANVDVGPMEAEDCTGSGPAGSEVRSEYKEGNNSLVMTRVKAPFPELGLELLQYAMEVGGGGGMWSWGWSRVSIGDWGQRRSGL